MAKKLSRNTLISLCLLAVGAAIVCYACLVVVWLGDDLDYGYFITTSIWNSYGNIDSLPDVFSSQGNHWMHVNGRYVAHVLVQIYCGLLGKYPFAICNALAYCLFVVLLCRFAGIRNPLKNPWTIAGTFALTLLIFVTKMMPSTQIGFVWMFTINLLWLWLLMFRHNMRRWVYALLVIAIAAIAGNGQEALSIGLAPSLVLWGLRRKTTWTQRVAIALYCAGTAANCLSPGTLSRTGTINITLADSLVYIAFSLRAVYLLFFVIIYVRFRKKIKLSEIYRHNALFINAAIVLLIFNTIIGVYSNRQLFGIELMAFIVTLRILPRHRFGKALSCLFVVLAIALVGIQLYMAQRVNKQYDEIVTQVKTENTAVYFNRTRASNNPWLREYRYYEEIVGQGYADTHHSMQKHIRATRKGRPRLTVWPTYVADYSTRKDTVIRYAQQHYYVVLKDSTLLAARIVSHNFVMGKTYSDTAVMETGKAAVTGTGWHGYLVVPARPFHTVDTVYLAQ